MCFQHDRLGSIVGTESLAERGEAWTHPPRAWFRAICVVAPSLVRRIRRKQGVLLGEQERGYLPLTMRVPSMSQ